MTDNVYAIPDTCGQARREDYENCEMERYMPDYRDRPRERAARADAYEDCDIQRPSLNSGRPVHQGSELGDHKERAPSKPLVLGITCFLLTMMGIIALAILYVLSQARWQAEISSLQGSLRNYQNVTDEDISELNKNLRHSQNIIEEDISDNKKHIAGLQRFSNIIPKNISDLNKSLRHSQNAIEEDISDLNESLRNLQNAIEEDITDLNTSLRHSQSAIDEEIREIHERLTELQLNVSLINCLRHGGMYVDDRCYKFYFGSMNFEQAVAECQKHGKTLAQFYTRKQQIALQDWIRQLLPSGNPELWIGMIHHPMGSTLEYRSGMKIQRSIFEWHGGHPQTATNLVIEVSKDDPSHGGLWDVSPTNTEEGALCEVVI